MHDDLRDLKLSKKVLQKLQNKDAIRQELQSGKTGQEVLEVSNKTMKTVNTAAKRLFDHGRYFDAANAFFFLVTLNPHQVDHWIGLGSSLQMCQDYESAIDAYELAAMCDFENPLPYFYLAKCLFAIHDREGALMALDLALEYAEVSDDYVEIFDQAMAAKKTLLQD